MPSLLRLRALPILALALFAGGRARADEPALPATPEPAPAPVDTVKVSVGAPLPVKGPLPKDTALALSKVEPAIETCYRDAIAKGTDGEGTMHVRLELVGPGLVVAATVTSSEEVSSKLRGCVRDAYAGVPAGAVGPAPSEVTVAIGFSRDVPDDFVRAASACTSTCEGTIDDGLVKEIRGRALRAGGCFKRAAAPGEPAILAKGTMNVSLRVAKDGSVCGVSIGNDVFGRPSLATCVSEAFEGAFSAPNDGCVDVSVPIAFKGS